MVQQEATNNDLWQDSDQKLIKECIDQALFDEQEDQFINREIQKYKQD